MNSERTQPLPLSPELEDRRHTVLDLLEALTNLIYLIGVDADRPENVRRYVTTAAGCLKALAVEVARDRDFARYSK